MLIHQSIVFLTLVHQIDWTEHRCELANGCETEAKPRHTAIGSRALAMVLVLPLAAFKRPIRQSQKQ